jgi:type II secretory pathway component PulF
MLATIQDLEVQCSPALVFLLELNRDHSQWLLLVPVLGGVLVMVWMISGRASSMAFRGPEQLFLVLPGTGSLIRNLQFYTLSRMLSLLVEKQLPLPDALRLAGATCGSPGLDAACSRAADQMDLGNVEGTSISSVRTQLVWRNGQLPPLLKVCLQQTSQEADRMLVRLKSITLYYRNRLDHQAAWLQTFMPFVLLLVMGGGAVLLYSTAIFWPIIELYRTVGTEVG